MEAGGGRMGHPGQLSPCRDQVPPKLHQGLEISTLWAAHNVLSDLRENLPKKPLNPPKSPQRCCPVLLAAGVDAQNSIVLTSITRTEGPTYQLERQEATPATSPPATTMATKELIIRRGLAVAAAIAVLALGIVIKLTTSKH